MTKAKARKHLAYAIESREFWREAYVEACRSKNSTMDTKGLYIAEKYATLRELKKAEAIVEIREANERIAKFERIVK